MKYYVYIFTIIAFLCQSFVGVAYAQDCQDMKSMDMASMSMSYDHTSPCPDNINYNKNTSDIDHCDGMCQCMHVSSTSIFMIVHHVDIYSPALKMDKIAIRQDHIHSFNNAPPLRPPKYTS